MTFQRNHNLHANRVQTALSWSKTTLIASSEVGAELDPLPCKTDKVFLRSLTLSVPIKRNFQSNGGKWTRLKLRKQFLH